MDSASWKKPQNDLKIIKIYPVLAETDADSARGVPISKGAPAGGSRGPKIWTPTFLDRLVPKQPKSTIKSILASKSYGSCLDDMSYHTNRLTTLRWLLGPSIYDVHKQGEGKVLTKVDACGQGQGRGRAIVTSTMKVNVFLSHVSILTRDIDRPIANLSVRLSVRLSVTFRYQMKTA